MKNNILCGFGEIMRNKTKSQQATFETPIKFKIADTRTVGQNKMFGPLTQMKSSNAGGQLRQGSIFFLGNNFKCTKIRPSKTRITE